MRILSRPAIMPSRYTRVWFCTKFYSTSRATIIHIPKANVFRFGDPNTAAAVFRDLQWTVQEDDAWAVIGSGSGEKTTLFQTLLGHLRISPAPPPPGGLFPFISSPSEDPNTSARDPYSSIALVSFSHRPRTTGGAFYDFTARYGAVRESDRLTLRQSMFPETVPPEFPALERRDEAVPKEPRMSELEKQVFEALIARLELGDLLDLPLIALSNGQTRRARIVKAILKKPELLLLDEPLTGLDVQSRPKLLEVLHALHTARAPRVILGLRTQDDVPEWVTHVAFVKGGEVIAGPKEEVLPTVEHISTTSGTGEVLKARGTGELVVDMQNVNVKYGNRAVLKGLNWQIRQGERWHLQGTNGSGKTTLLSLLTGAHPQSYTQPHLHLAGKPRKSLPTPHLQSLVAQLSPELFDAFPRRAGTSVWDAVSTGFDGGFVPQGSGKEPVGVGVMRALTEEEVKWRVQRCWSVLEALGPAAWGAEGRSADKGGPGADTRAFARRQFVDLHVGEQRMVLLMRALVGRAPLVLLDEVWSGMGEGMIRAARKYLRSEEGLSPAQAAVVITHWEEEVPWTLEEGLRRFKLDGGIGQVVE